jgi:lycopene cyclase domain-containing protein
MEYTFAAVAALALTVSLAAVHGLLARRAYWIGLVGFAVLTVVADSMLVGRGVFGFGGRFISGIHIWRMPIEDLLYGSALYSLAVTAFEWNATGRRNLSDLLTASRPFSWINTALPCLACGIAVGRPGAALVIGTVYFLAPYNLLMYGANDVFDYESDRRNPRKNSAVEGGLAPPGRRTLLWVAIAVTNLPFLAVLAWLGGPIVAAAVVATAIVALVYSVPPLRTKEIAGLDALTSALHFVLPCACGALLAGAAFGALPWRILVAFLCWGAASQALGAIQDTEFDRQAGIGSIAVSLGPRATAIVSAGLYTAAAALVASAGGLAVVAAVALLPYPLLAASCLAGDAQLQARRAWKGFLGMNLLSGFLITQVLLRAWGVADVTGLELFSWGSALGVLLVLGMFAANRVGMRRRVKPAGPELVTVVVPVRNEEARIAACLQVLPRAAEIIVVDDGSTDRTMAVAAAMLGPRGSVVSAGERPQGWTGKCWAAWRGAELASREVVVFLDADTVVGDQALGAAAAEVMSTGGLVSLLTRYDMPTPAERVMMPAFGLMQLATWPLALMPLAYGPFMAARRTEYLELGGHRAIAGSDREDVDLARLFAAARRPVRVVHGADLGATRHYARAGQVAAAWRRMYYAYCGYSLAIALAGLCGLAIVFLLPLLTFAAAWAGADRPALLGASVGLLGLLVLRAAFALSERQPLSTIAWHPVTWMGTLWAMSLSVADGLRGRPPVWRGSELAGQAR